MKIKKVRVILDSDTANEIDDAFALAYACVCRDKFDIKAITLAPFSVEYKRINIKDGLIESKLEANRILRLAGFRDLNLVFRGSEDFYNDQLEASEASNKIIEEAKKGELTIVCLGVLTNVAVAIRDCPEIAKNLHVIWLGTRHLFYDSFDDTNFRHDKRAFELVVKSDVKLTIIPSYIGKFIQTSESSMKTTVAVNDLGRYLYRIMRNSQFSQPCMGVRTIYDVAPVGYLVNPKWFYEKEIPANEVLKEFTKTDPKRMINYVYDMQPNSVVWIDFVNRLSHLGNAVTRQKCFFISDTHFGDNRKYKIKQTIFSSVEEIEREVVKRWNSVVSRKDTVYHLGDFGTPSVIKKLNGKVTLICGNHEKDAMKKTGESFEAFRARYIGMGFQDVIKDGIWLDEKVFGRPVYMTHRPTACKKGYANLFGHVHSLKPIMKDGVNVAMVYHDYTPMSEKQIRKALEFVCSSDLDSDALR